TTGARPVHADIAADLVPAVAEARVGELTGTIEDIAVVADLRVVCEAAEAGERTGQEGELLLVVEFDAGTVRLAAVAMGREPPSLEERIAVIALGTEILDEALLDVVEIGAEPGDGDRGDAGGIVFDAEVQVA